MEVSVYRLVITDGEVLPGVIGLKAAGLRLLLALAGVYPGLAKLSTQRIKHQQRDNTISQQANLKNGIIIVLPKIEDTQRLCKSPIH